MNNKRISGIISHADKNNDFEITFKKLKENLVKKHNESICPLDEQIKILDELKNFELGRYWISNNGGWNGYWTDYVLTFPKNGRLTGLSSDGSKLSALEDFILNNSPIVRATQQRFNIFLAENAKIIREGACMASLPCGLLGELLYLDYSKTNNFNLFGIDLDSDSLELSKENAKKHGVFSHVEFVKQDAWNLSFKSKFDLISSNGLNIYEPDKERVKMLYKKFYSALKTGGKLVTSYIGYPPSYPPLCEWKLNKINSKDLRLSYIIFTVVLGAIWQNYTSKAEMTELLTKVGFSDIEIYYDECHIFPTVTAVKKQNVSLQKQE